jgi:hypothetical protein
MKILLSALSELMGLFVEDGALAFAIVATVTLAGSVAVLLPATPTASGTILLLGCLAVLFVNVMRAPQR